ncbi:MAG: nitroreductase [Actinomycetes bacterium]
MQVTHAIRARRSVRAFTAQPVSAQMIRQILELSLWAPSWANAQAWNVFVLTGAPLEVLKEELAKKAESGQADPTDLPMPPRVWPEYLRERMVVRSLASETADEHAPVRPAVGPSGWQLYGAPCLLLFAIDEQLEPRYACVDAGLLVQTICLAAEDRGLATCVMATAVRFPGVLHELIPEAKGMRFVVGLALGQVDTDAAVNRSERKRVGVDEIVHWVE